MCNLTSKTGSLFFFQQGKTEERRLIIFREDEKILLWAIEVTLEHEREQTGREFRFFVFLWLSGRNSSRITPNFIFWTNHRYRVPASSPTHLLKPLSVSPPLMSLISQENMEHVLKKTKGKEFEQEKKDLVGSLYDVTILNHQRT